MHSRLFADLLLAAGLKDDYLGYLDVVPAVTLATVNFMSLCGLHRAYTPMLVGMFAAAEITTAPSARRMVEALERLGATTRASSSTPSTSRPTPSTSSSCGTTWWVT